MTTAAPWNSFLLSFWNVLMLASAVVEIVGYTALPAILKRSYGCYLIPEQRQSIVGKLWRIISGRLHSSMNTRITTTDLWNCTTTATKTETRGEQHIRYNKSNQRRDSYSNLDFDYCCGFIYRYRVRSSALFTSLGYIHAFVIAIQLAQRRKCELDSTREYTMVNWQQGQDEVILTIKKRIVNYFHHMLKDLYPSASSFSTSILVKVDMLDVIIYAWLRILCYWSLLPHSL